MLASAAPVQETHAVGRYVDPARDLRQDRVAGQGVLESGRHPRAGLAGPHDHDPPHITYREGLSAHDQFVVPDADRCAHQHVRSDRNPG